MSSRSLSPFFSFLHPEHEERIAAALASLGVPISLSSRVLPEYREYERTSTVVINAYLQPLMGRYLNRLSGKDQNTKHKAQSTGFALRVMQSSGGSISADLAAVEPVRTILSGPSGGVVRALRWPVLQTSFVRHGRYFYRRSALRRWFDTDNE